MKANINKRMELTLTNEQLAEVVRTYFDLPMQPDTGRVFDKTTGSVIFVYETDYEDER